MKVVIKVKNLLKAVNICSRLVGSRNSLEILGNILIETDKNILKLSSTNLDMAITTQLGAKVEKQGKISIPARLFNELISSTTEETLQLISDSDKLTIKGQNIHSKLNGVNANEFPTLPKLKDTTSITLDAQIIKKLIDKTMISVGIDESRPVLAGIYFNLVDSKLTMVATDSYRLSEASSKVDIQDSLNCIIPARTITEIQRLTSIEEVATIELKISESEASFVIGESELITQLTEGKYPEYSKIIPSDSKTNIVCNTKELQEAVKVSTVFARESSHSINLTIKDKQLIINAQTSEVGENTINVDIEKNGPNTDIAINAKYLNDILGVIESPKIEIGLNDKLDPLLIKPNNIKDELYIIMPLRS